MNAMLQLLLEPFTEQLLIKNKMAVTSFTYTPKNVCSRQFEFTFDGDVILSLKITRGCPGNTQGISKLVAGRKIDEVISLLKGIVCPSTREAKTSCPDQIAEALMAYKAQRNG